METFSEDSFEFGETRIVGGDQKIGAQVIGGLGEPDGMRKERKFVWLLLVRKDCIRLVVEGSRSSG